MFLGLTYASQLGNSNLGLKVSHEAMIRLPTAIIEPAQIPNHALPCIMAKADVMKHFVITIHLPAQDASRNNLALT